jgi:hypothetical protein
VTWWSTASKRVFLRLCKKTEVFLALALAPEQEVL